MAAYYPASSNERDHVPVNYSRELTPGSYLGAPVLPGTMMYMSYSSSSGPYPDTLVGNSQQENTDIGMPPVGVSDSTVLHHEFLSNLGGSRIGNHNFTAWRDGRNEVMPMQPVEGDTSNLHGGQNVQGQGLSLSLSPQIPSGIQISSLQYKNHNSVASSFLSPNTSASGENLTFRDDETSQSKQSRNTEYMQPDFRGSGSDIMKGDVSPYMMSNIARNIPNSKYLKAAQQLLDEVVNMCQALKKPDSKKDSERVPKEVDEVAKNGASVPSASSNAQDSTSNPSELSSSEKQEQQNKMTKLLSMLDEVDRRYRQYFHQMQIVVSSFDVIAGCGAAKPYTAPALQTISRHFRCLRDAINGQIRVTQRSLGEHDGSANSKGVGISRLRFVDQQLRQQRPLQHLGMMQQHTWRPQRGLPESSVTILRAWLFEHFLHPYPKDSDKIMLARQTGLTRSQVSNWFINARVRLWKPMVEEMYKEEAADAEMDSNSSSDVVTKATNRDLKISEDRVEDVQNSATSTATMKCSTGQFSASNTSHVPDVEMVGPSTESVFSILNCGENQARYKVGISREDQRPNVNEYNVIPGTMVQPNERFMATYNIPELERFENRSGVSLTLGLQHCEDGSSIPMSAGNHNFASMRGEDVYDPTATQAGTETVDFDCMDSGNREHRFGSSHLLHDFVA
ncbi:BEL1-like homeodomain protein 7 [Heracleum sosnowskyi]|uniref:BEL1-like homeodomain protein 7 n=1 Tax=Heracleum sosnowskyi TaxID=360622 RepID=A0AAD8GPG7_9APIA|nr:BEL1-like homeodomain protein 7 [Heracleum sosnowskyi]